MLKVDLNQRDRELEGKWFDYQDGARFKLAPWNNVKYVTELSANPEITNPEATMGKLDRYDFLCKVMGESILIDWEGLADMQGKPLEFSSERATKLLMNDVEVFNFVRTSAIQHREDMQNRIKTDSKKSSASSSGENDSNQMNTSSSPSSKVKATQ